MKSFTFLLTICFISINATSIAQPGTLDNSFGNGGVVIDGGGSASCITSALQKDGKIILAGSGSDGINTGFLLLRYKSTGQIDSAFGINGKAALDFTDEGIYEHFASINAIIIMSDNKILAAGAGYIQVIGGENGEDFNSNLLVARFLPDGKPDSSFGNNAKVMTDFGSYDETANDMVVQEDGKIVIGGNTGGIPNLLLVRYRPDGQLDESFGVGGHVVTDLGASTHDVLRSIALQPDGKIVAGGLTGSKFLLARYNTTGALDASFGNRGLVITDFGPQGEEIHDIALQLDGKIIAAGIANVSFSFIENMAIARYDSTGKLDQDFGDKGKVNIQFLEGASRAESVALQPSDGKIVLGGWEYLIFDNIMHFALARCNKDGSLDSTFGTNGKTVTDLGGADNATKCLLQNDGRIILTGNSQVDQQPSNIALARYLGDPSTVRPTIAQIKRWIRNNILHFEDANTNAAYYVIEKSTANNGAFVPVTKITANAATSNYSYTLPETATQSTYRIKAVNKDNSITYSSPISSSDPAKAGVASFTIYPNPAKDRITVETAGTVQLRLQNSNGRVLLTQSVNGKGSIDISKLPNGIYYVVNTVTGESLKVVKE